MNRFTKLRVVAFVGLLLVANLLQAAEQIDSDLYQKGIELVESNCYDCNSGTKGGLEQGILILDALSQKEIADARLFYVLGEGYIDLANTHYPSGSKERARYRKKAAEALKRATELEPDNIKYFLRHVGGLPYNDQIVELEKVYEKSAGACRSLAMIYIHSRNEIDKGLGYMRLAYQQSIRMTKVHYGAELLDLIKVYRSAAEYEEFKAIYLKDKENILNPK